MPSIVRICSAFFMLLCVGPFTATARKPSVNSGTEPTQVVQELRAFFAGQDQANRDGQNTTELAKRFYSEDAIITGEGDPVPKRGIKDAVIALDNWFAYLGPDGNKGCAFAVQDAVVSSSGDMASVFAELTCKPNPPKTSTQETIRQLFVLKRTPQGWRVFREMWQAGSLGS